MCVCVCVCVFSLPLKGRGLKSEFRYNEIITLGDMYDECVAEETAVPAVGHLQARYSYGKRFHIIYFFLGNSPASEF